MPPCSTISRCEPAIALFGQMMIGSRRLPARPPNYVPAPSATCAVIQKNSGSSSTLVDRLDPSPQMVAIASVDHEVQPPCRAASDYSLKGPGDYEIQTSRSAAGVLRTSAKILRKTSDFGPARILCILPDPSAHSSFHLVGCPGRSRVAFEVSKVANHRASPPGSRHYRWITRRAR